MSAARVVVLTRTPEPGRVKTRLIPALGAEGAARLHEAMALEVVGRALRSGLGVDVRLSGAPDHPFACALEALGARVLPQGEGDLGERLLRALSGGERRLALGTDCLGFDPAWLREAASLDEVALGPAEDGGYWTIGLRDPPPELFRGVPWSTADVLQATLQRASALGLRVRLLPTCYDIDTPEDLARLRLDPACPPSLLPLLGPP